MIAIMREAARSGPSAALGRLLRALALMLGGLIAASGAAAETEVAAARTNDVAAFPLAVTPGKRYLEDADGKPFLIHGDTAWSLIADLSRDDVELYLDDRRARGFNTILVSLLEHRFSSNAPANASDELPFHGQPFETVASLASLVPYGFAHYGTGLATLVADYSMPNEEYFAHADWVLRRAADKGFLVLLTPSYVGYDGGADGWYRAMVANGPERLRQYGEYLGRRYRDFANIVWVHAGDYNPPDKDLVRAIVEGIQRFDSRALHTAHGAPETAAIEYWQAEPWLQVNNVYTYGSVHAPALAQYARPERMPFFLIESAYENEHETTEQRLRTQAYQAVLSGAAGQIFGNNPIWHFDGPGIYPAPVTWQQAMDGRGTQSMTHLHDLLTSMPWWLLEPDVGGTLLTDGLGPEDQRAVAARAVDGSFAVLYLPSSRDVTVDLAQLAGSEISARWYDPADGRFSVVSGSPFSATGPRRFRPESSNNSSGFDDWVLVLEAQA
jgi:Protein of unknown function (DUF4038)/Putative collagen-binding domain of a collagenase